MERRELTEDENWIVGHWSMFGSAGYPIRKLGSKRWIVAGQRGRGSCPKVFTTKRAASEQWESFVRSLWTVAR